MDLGLVHLTQASFLYSCPPVMIITLAHCGGIYKPQKNNTEKNCPRNLTEGPTVYTSELPGPQRPGSVRRQREEARKTAVGQTLARVAQWSEQPTMGMR